METPEHVVIIGNGIAGITAARHIRRLSRKKITVISRENEYFFSRTALMYVYMGHMRWGDIEPYPRDYWSKNNIDLICGQVETVDPHSQHIELSEGQTLHFDYLIIATGSHPRFLNWSGSQLQGIQGLVTKQDLELLEKNTLKAKKAVIVGGGLIGVEMAEMLMTRGIEVTMIIREKSFWRNVLPPEDSEFVTKHLEDHRLHLKKTTEVLSFDGEKRVEKVRTTNGVEACDFVGVCIGVAPNIKFLADSGIQCDKGVLVNSELRTNFPNIFAIGDCAEQVTPAEGRSSIEATWYTSRMMGETVAQTICGRTFQYRPGPWFNSAKFFDLEYQTYGRVSPNPNSEEKHLHWNNVEKRKAMTIAYNPGNNRFMGINCLGLRMRHDVFDQWLRDQKEIGFVMDHLDIASFEPELSKNFFSQIQKKFRTSLNLTFK